jgi:hypothetical protein
VLCEYSWIWLARDNCRMMRNVILEQSKNSILINVFVTRHLFEFAILLHLSRTIENNFSKWKMFYLL